MLVEQKCSLTLTFTGREVEIFESLIRLGFRLADDCSEEEDLAAIILNKLEEK